MSAAPASSQSPLPKAQARAAGGWWRPMLWAATAVGTTGALRLAALLALAALLTPTDFGVVAWLWWLADLGALVASAGFGPALTRFVAVAQGGGRNEEAASAGRWLTWLGLGAGGAVALVLAAILGVTKGETVSVGLVSLTAVLAWCQTGAALAGCRWQGQLRFGRSAGWALAGGLLSLLGGAAGALGGSNETVLLGLLLGPLAVCVGDWVERGRWAGARDALPPGWWPQVWALVVSTGLTTALGGLAWSRGEAVLLGWWSTPAAVAAYAPAVVFASLVSQAGLLWRGFFLPQLASARHPRQQVHRYRVGTVWLATLLLPVAALSAALAPLAAQWWPGGAQVGLAPLWAVLAAGTIVHLSSVGGALATAQLRHRFLVGNGVFGVVLLFGVGGWTIPALGEWGAAATRWAAQGGTAVASIWYFQRCAGAAFPWRRVGRLAVAAVAATGVLYLCWWDRSQGLGAWLGGVAAMVLYAVLAWRWARCDRLWRSRG